jgi:aryl-alcohol dehydrogenase-like predicted oxidoreductase
MPPQAIAIETRPCGTSGLRLPVVGLGCWAFGGGEYWGPQSQEDVTAVVHAALDLGITYFDTAEAYNGGASETSLGQALRGRRAQAIVGSKVNPSNTRPAALRAHCEASLQRLGTEWIDLYMIHWPINTSAIQHFTSDADLLAQPPDLGEALATLEALKGEGKIRHWGLSNFGVRQLEEVTALGFRPASDELAYNLLMRGIEAEVLPWCRAHGVGVLGYSALMQGLLSGRFASIDELPPARTRTRHFAGTRPGSRHGGPGVEAETWAALQAIAAVAAERGVPVGDLAIAWAVANPAITCTIVGCRNRRQLEENVRALSLDLSAELKQRLDRATADVLAKLGPHIDYYQSVADSRSF